MRHKVHSHSFNRKGGPRKALIKGLVISLVEHGRIRTTLTKAKELRRHVERAITLAKKGDGARRVLISRLGHEGTVKTLVTDLGKRFSKRAGGYTRILKLNARPGDLAPMALIEFVDYVLPEAAKDGETTVRGDKGATKRAKELARDNARSKKHRRQIQVASRRANA